MNMRFIVLAFVLPLSSCSYDLIVSDTGREYVREFIEPEDSFVGSVPVRIVPGAERRFYRGYARTVFTVERIWTRIFSTEEDTEATLQVTSAGFTRSTFNTRAYNTTYLVEAEFRCGGMTYPISAKGSRDTPARDYIKQDIVQQAVRIVADRAVEHLERCRDAAPGTDEK